MSKGEDLFDSIDSIDTSMFETGAEPSAEPTTEKKENNKEEDEDTPPVNDGEIDSAFFEVEPSEDNKGSEDPEDVNNDGTSADNSSSPLQLIASTLQAEGLIDLEEGVEIKSAKDLIDGWRKGMLKHEFNDLTEEQKLYVQSLRNGIPEEEVKTNFNNLKALDSIQPEAIESNEELQKILITQDFIAKGIEESKAVKLAERSIELGESADDAKEAYSSLKTIESNRIKEENARIEKERAAKAKEDEEKLSELKDTILNTEEFIPGIKSNSTTKQKVFENMTKVVDYDKQGKPLTALAKARLENPEKYAMMESVFYTLTKGFTDFSKFTKDVKSNAIQELDEKLKGSNTGGGTPRGIQSTTQKDLLDAVRNLKL